MVILIWMSVASFCQTAREKYNFNLLSNDILQIVKETKAVGVSVALIDNYEVVWARGFGMNEIGTTDSVRITTLFQAASITKPVTAMAVVKKFNQGAILLTDDVDKQLISWHIPENYLTKEAPVTVKQLLSHTSGITNKEVPMYHPNDKLPTLVQALKGESPAENEPVVMAYYPGKTFSYSGWGYGILELLLMDTEKKNFPKVIQDEVFDPLQMSNSTFAYQLPNEKFKSIAYGHEQNKVFEHKYYVMEPLSPGGLWTTPTDLAKFIIEIQLSLIGKSNKVLTQNSTKLMLTPVLNDYALGFTKERRGNNVLFFGHDGQNYGYICSMLGSVENGRGVVIMTNSDNGWKAINKIKKLVGRKYWGF